MGDRGCSRLCGSATCCGNRMCAPSPKPPMSPMWTVLEGGREVAADGGGKLVEVVLRAGIVVAEDSMRAKALELHVEAK